ncbi:hypothetical protein NDU88_000785 [Pleurodeles waltl]|uniref:Uncharacterized protein n=1 Tax=Pleurodeles waltl TaxID=8319 RepID=A0AAV7Q1T2_PLEWA|nr:hypothetical protein NDU88_000785 [Pleurodeles waltl]
MIRSAVFCWRGGAAVSSSALPPSAAMTVGGVPPAFCRYTVGGHDMRRQLVATAARQCDELASLFYQKVEKIHSQLARDFLKVDLDPDMTMVNVPVEEGNVPSSQSGYDTKLSDCPILDFSSVLAILQSIKSGSPLDPRPPTRVTNLAAAKYTPRPRPYSVVSEQPRRCERHKRHN